MTETKAELARTLRQAPKRMVKEICKKLQISEATFYRYSEQNLFRLLPHLPLPWSDRVPITLNEEYAHGGQRQRSGTSAPARLRAATRRRGCRVWRRRQGVPALDRRHDYPDRIA